VSFVSEIQGTIIGRTTDEDGLDFLTPIRLAEMQEWLRSLDVDPDTVAIRAAIVREARPAQSGGDRFFLALTEYVRSEDGGQFVLDLAAGLPVSVPRIVEVADGSWPSWLLGLGL
jgi:hypothetical protein